MTTFRLVSPLVRSNAINAVKSAPDGWVLTISEPKRTALQNNLLWALLTDLAKAKPEGREWEPTTWKSAMLHYLGHQVAFAEGLDGSGPFPIGFRSSQLTTKQMGDLIDCILSYGAEHGVEFKEARQGGFDDLMRRSG